MRHSLAEGVHARRGRETADKGSDLNYGSSEVVGHVWTRRGLVPDRRFWSKKQQGRHGWVPTLSRFNAGEGSRIPNLLIRSQMLYPIELRPRYIGG